MSDDPISLLREVSANFQIRLSEMKAIETANLAPFQARLLSVISRSPGISQLSLAASTERDKAQIARAIKELERRGFIIRAVHATDWRTQCLNVTQEGRRASTVINLERTELVTKALNQCSIKEQETLCNILSKINQSLRD